MPPNPPPKKQVKIQLPGGEVMTAPPPIEPAPKAAAPRGERFFRVTNDVQVPQGASHYLLKAGQVISSYGYDVDELLRLGAPLEPTNGPVRYENVLQIA